MTTTGERCGQCGMPWSRHNAGALVPVCDNRQDTPSGAEATYSPETTERVMCTDCKLVRVPCERHREDPKP